MMDGLATADWFCGPASEEEPPAGAGWGLGRNGTAGALTLAAVEDGAAGDGAAGFGCPAMATSSAKGSKTLSPGVGAATGSGSTTRWGAAEWIWPEAAAKSRSLAGDGGVGEGATDDADAEDDGAAGRSEWSDEGVSRPVAGMGDAGPSGLSGILKPDPPALPPSAVPVSGWRRSSHWRENAASRSKGSSSGASAA
jgi:hypothetical protein